jgi:methylmalonyl-CoA mutase
MPVSFTEFSSSSYKSWLEVLKKELKVDDASRFLSISSGGLDIPAYLNSNLQQQVLHIDTFRKPLHPEFAYANEWRKNVHVNADDPLLANKQALSALKLGADSVCFYGLGITTQEELRLTLKDIIPEYISLNFRCEEGSPALLFMLIDEFSNRNYATNKLVGSIEFDVLTDCMKHGLFPYSKVESLSIVKAMLEQSRLELPMFRNLVVNASIFYEAGAEEADELAFTLLVFQEYFESFSSELSPEKLAAMARVRLSCSTDYFSSIAKMRALRFLWHMFLDAWNVDSSKFPIEIAAETCLRNKTLYDPYTNLIRATTEGMSAIIGGADSLTIHPHDCFSVNPNADSWRLALNVQHLLHDEAQLDKVCDPAAGSWFIDHLTQKMVERAWEQFQLLIKQGSFSALLEKNIIQDRIKASANQIRNKIRTRTNGIVGTSQFAAAGEALSPFLLKRDPLAKPPIFKTVEPLRDSDWFEQARFYIQNKRKCSAYLVLFGDVKMANLRSNFCRDILSIFGFQIHMGSIQVSPVEQIHSAHAHAADIIIFCASNGDYTVELAKQMHSEIGLTPIWIAGKCENQEELKKAGIDDFLYLGSDLEGLFRRFLVNMVNADTYEA